MTEEIFTAYDIRGKVTEGLSLEVAWNIGKALADLLATYGVVTVMRGGGANEPLCGALIEGLRLQGRDVLDAGSGDKAAFKALIKDRGLSGGIYIDHDTEQDVCVTELYNEQAQPIRAENGLSEITELVRAGNFVPAAVKGELTAIA